MHVDYHTKSPTFDDLNGHYRKPQISYFVLNHNIYNRENHNFW